MDMNSIVARLLTGFATKAIAVGLAVWAATEAYSYVTGVFAAAAKGMA